MHLLFTGLAICATLRLTLAADLPALDRGDLARKVPVIYCTDLFHPHEDPDDHFDLATLYAMRELDIRGIVLDQGARQLQRPGRIPVSQLNRITGRRVPTAIGLANPLKDPHDAALDQQPEFQLAVRMILDILRASPIPVRIAAVGSMRDVVAAFNREPALFRRQVAMILAFIGEASDPALREYNVALDPQAYIGLMRSGLPVYWVPCFDGGIWQNRGHASFWQAKQEALLSGACTEILQYFIYALDKEQAEPLDFLRRPVEARRKTAIFEQTRNLWCTAIFGVLSGRQIVMEGQNYRSALPSESMPQDLLFCFKPVDLTVTDRAVIHYGSGPDAKRVMRFEITDPAHYAAGMTKATAELLAGLRPKP